jgi:16S rRNA (cytidine1402-2'-O)-methyltransferase
LPPPIGNLGDITQRALETLREVDLIAAEDTRHSAALMRHFNVATPLVSYHDHSKESEVLQLLDHLRSGRSVALISDAGTPLVSDPGYRLVAACHTESIPVVPIPGASALTAALSASGLPTNRFHFEGFFASEVWSTQVASQGHSTSGIDAGLVRSAAQATRISDGVT